MVSGWWDSSISASRRESIERDAEEMRWKCFACLVGSSSTWQNLFF